MDSHREDSLNRYCTCLLVFQKGRERFLCTLLFTFLQSLKALKIAINVDDFKQKKTKFCKLGEPRRHVCCEQVVLNVLDETQFQRKQAMT